MSIVRVVTNNGKPELVIRSRNNGGGALVKWSCSCSGATLREDFSTMRMECPVCGVVLTGKDAVDMMRAASDSLNQMIDLLGDEAEIVLSDREPGDESESQPDEQGPGDDAEPSPDGKEPATKRKQKKDSG